MSQTNPAPDAAAPAVVTPPIIFDDRPSPTYEDGIREGLERAEKAVQCEKGERHMNPQAALEAAAAAIRAMKEQTDE